MRASGRYPEGSGASKPITRPPRRLPDSNPGRTETGRYSTRKRIAETPQDISNPSPRPAGFSEALAGCSNAVRGLYGVHRGFDPPTASRPSGTRIIC
ncbi:hypothetical protein HZH68_001728 [Vespula germanica]|uniref:Uncharacterized protein n=1 Tax=Vespula germanica TaxID=30212 RepID=A0A834NW42_VESGE|nr:hypothetical protein HZH68_001728 [Vespula germanica]